MTTKVALVTGANRGIGFEVCRQLAKKGLQVVLTSRDAEKGKQAQAALSKEGIKVDYCQLDTTHSESIEKAFEFVASKFRRLDILVNNAGVFIESSEESTGYGGASLLTTNLDVIRKTMETNTLGPILMIQKFVPLMKQNHYGRIVNISSGMGQLSEMNGRWPGYRLSKTALNAVTRIAADELQGTEILVNSVCPGWVKTDMGGPEAEVTVEEGADTVVWLATLPEGGPTGGFFRERKRIEW